MFALRQNVIKKSPMNWIQGPTYVSKNHISPFRKLFFLFFITSLFINHVTFLPLFFSFLYLFYLLVWIFPYILTLSSFSFTFSPFSLPLYICRPKCHRLKPPPPVFSNGQGGDVRTSWLNLCLFRTSGSTSSASTCRRKSGTLSARNGGPWFL